MGAKLKLKYDEASKTYTVHDLASGAELEGVVDVEVSPIATSKAEDGIPTVSIRVKLLGGIEVVEAPVP